MSVSWSERRVGEFATRKKVINESGEDLPPLSVTKDRGVLLQSEKYKKRVATDPRKYAVVEDGDFAFDPMSLYYGALGRVGGIGRGLISPDYAAFTVDSTVDPEFLEYKLRSREMIRVYERVAQAGNQFGKRRRVYWSVLADLPISLPPLNEQREIAATLKLVDEAVAAGEAVIEQLERVKRSIAEVLFAGQGSRPEGRLTKRDLPSGWSVVRLEDVAEIGNGTTPSRQRADYWAGGTVPWLPTGKVNDRVITSADEFVTAKALEECSLRMLPRGTVLVAMIGQGKTRGMAAYLDMEACINQNFAYIRPGERVRSWYLFHVLEHHYDRVRASSQGSNQGALNCGILKKYMIPLPPLEEQCAIADVISAMMERIGAERAVLAERRRVKAALADALLSGRLRVRDAA